MSEDPQQKINVTDLFSQQNHHVFQTYPLTKLLFVQKIETQFARAALLNQEKHNKYALGNFL